VSNALSRTVRRLAADQRLRFLVVGGVNTLVGLAAFSAFELTIGRYLGQFGYLASLLFSYAIGITVAFTLHRKFVFKVRGNVLVDLGRFVLANMVGLGFNTLILPLLVTVSGLPPIIAQAISAFIVAIASYFMHKHFSFRRKAEAH
jgi:putative flippase GtrA